MEENKEQIEDEFEVLQSILMDEIQPTDVEGTVEQINIDGEETKVEIVKGFKIKIFPEEDVPAKMTKIISKTSNNSQPASLDEEEKGETGVNIRVLKVDYLPPLELEIKVPSTYPSDSPPLYTIKNDEFYKGNHDMIEEKLLEMWEPGITCIYEWYAYFQNGFVADYMEMKKLNSLRYMVTNRNEYDDFMSRTRDAFAFKLSKELQTCMICFESFYGNEFFIFSSCSHFFCLRCIKAYCQSLIVDGQIKNLVCPDTRCKKLIPEEDIKALVTEDLYKKYIQFDLNNQVNNDETLTWCPIPECGAVAKIRGGNMFGECTECWFRFCLTCQMFYHSGRR